MSASPVSVPDDTEVTFARDGDLARWLTVEADLARALGRAPTEEETLEEYDRRVPQA